MRSLAAIAVALVCTGLVAADAQAQRRDRDRDRLEWVDLGCKQVNFVGADRDSIVVGRREGRFRAIRLTARGNDVEMLDLRVVYTNGGIDDIPVRSLIRQGRYTRALDLRGRERAIQRIDMVYRKRMNLKGLLGGTATVCVEGLQD
jgi:hypothetical protein